jgi:hypothetical protein
MHCANEASLTSDFNPVPPSPWVSSSYHRAQASVPIDSLRDLVLKQKLPAADGRHWWVRWASSIPTARLFRLLRAPESRFH